MLDGLLIATNSFISLAYFIIALLILLPFLHRQQKTKFVLASILIFISGALENGKHVLNMISSVDQSSPLYVKFELGVDLIAASVAIIYITCWRQYSFLVDGEFLLSQAEEKVELLNTELKSVYSKLESLVSERTAELYLSNQKLAAVAAERKEIISALNRSNAFLKALQEATADGILVVDEQNQILFYNQNFYQIWEIPESIIQLGNNRKLLEFAVTKTQNPEEFITKVNYLYQHPEIDSQDEILLQDGRTLDRYSTSVRSSGNYYGRIWYFRDISERKAASAALLASQTLLKQKAEQLETALHQLQDTQVQLIQSEKMSALGQLVAGVAHEINNPMNFIYANLTYVTQYTQDLMELLKCYQHSYPNPTRAVKAKAKQIDYEYIMGDLPKILSSMNVGAERIREIVLSLRTFSRLDEAAMKAVNLHDGIDSTLLILQSRLTSRTGKKIQVIKDYGDLPDVECFAGQLNQVFMNVLCKAIDALETANSEIPTIQIRTELREEKQVVITISDNGPGIPETVRNRIFDPFFTTKPVGKGTGLGLSISYKIVVDKHGGLLNVTSVPGEGTEFTIQIPLYQNLSIPG